MVDFNGHIGVIKKGENKGRDRQGLEKEHEIQKMKERITQMNRY